MKAPQCSVRMGCSDALQGLLLLLAAQRPFFSSSICPQEAPGCWRKSFSLLLLWIMVSALTLGQLLRGDPQG